jgi:DNA-binding CsgD family transcriptional regulator
MPDNLIDSIYEAAVNSELWPTVLETMSEIAGAEGGVLFASGTGAPKWVSTVRMRPHMEAFIAEGWAANNSRAAAAFRKRLPAFATDHDTLSDEEIETSPLYRDFFRPRGLGWSVGTSIVPLTGDVLILSFERRHDRGPVENDVKDRLNPLRPHLARSTLLAARFGLERARGIVAGLNLVGLAAAVVTSSGTVVAENSHLEQMTEFVRIGAFERISFIDATAQKSLVTALEGLVQKQGTSRPPMSIPIKPEDGPPAIAHLIPLIATARDIFTQGDALLIVSKIGAGNVPGASLLEALFDLTPAESRVAHLLVEGVPAPLLAQKLSVSAETVRTHIKSVLRKAGVHRQVDLVRLVSGLPIA